MFRADPAAHIPPDAFIQPRSDASVSLNTAEWFRVFIFSRFCYDNVFILLLHRFVVISIQPSGCTSVVNFIINSSILFSGGEIKR